MPPAFLPHLWQRHVVALIGGAIGPLALAPFNWWLLGLISIATLAFTMLGQNARRCTALAFVFGLGMYGVGASWVFISINQFGSTSVPLSLVLTGAFVTGLALCFALPFYAYGRWFNTSAWGLMFAFPAFWVLDEWMRSWLLTGFPWLYYGYSHLHTPLAGWAPVLGVFGVGFIASFTACVLLAGALRLASRALLLRCIVASAMLWAVGAGLRFIEWTELEPEPITLGMAQGNIPQERKWDPRFLNETFSIFNGLSKPLWQYDWVIWPEAAIPLLYHEAQGDLESLGEHAANTDTVFITGILYDDRDNRQYYNSLVALGRGSGITFKTRLVPFGEYVPMEGWLRGLISFFDLPTSVMHRGPEYTSGLNANGVIIAPSICYEVVYPDLVARRAASANVLLTVSNDAWFGRSIGPVQHFQMAQMRALETGRYMVRATNNGISGIIDHKGKVVVKGGRYTREAISGQIFAAHGLTPFIFWGSWPAILLCAMALMGVLVKDRAVRTSNSPAASSLNE